MDYRRELTEDERRVEFSPRVETEENEEAETVEMTEDMIAEARHDSRRVEYVRELVQDNGPLTSSEAYKVESYLGGIMAKHQIARPYQSFENFCGGVGVAVSACDHIMRTLNERIHARR